MLTLDRKTYTLDITTPNIMYEINAWELQDNNTRLHFLLVVMSVADVAHKTVLRSDQPWLQKSK
jgi:hypothetical protein